MEKAKKPPFLQSALTTEEVHIVEQAPFSPDHSTEKNIHLQWKDVPKKLKIATQQQKPVGAGHISGYQCN